MIELILNEMKRLIEVNNFDLLRRYPDDLLVHDRATLERVAHRGASIAWMVGHSHTHIAPLGIHRKSNEMVTYLTDLSEDDRFYCIKVGNGTFLIKEVGRDGFRSLVSTPVPYNRKGSVDNFWLFKDNEKIGHCAININGSFESRYYSVKITPMYEISSMDKAALHKWASHGVTELAHTLFVKYEIVWDEPFHLKLAA